MDSLQSTVSESESIELPDGTKQISWKDNDLLVKMGEQPRDYIKVATKVFLNNCSEVDLRAAIENAFRILDTDFLDTLILAFHPCSGNEHSSDEIEVKEGVIEWGDGTEKSLEQLKKLWRVLEEYSEAKKIKQLGVSDLNADILKKLYEWSKEQPTMIQINLSACCVVPPDLKDFCNEKEIQLLTHSDPPRKFLPCIFKKKPKK